MKRAVFETTLLPDGHLDCPSEFAHRKDADDFLSEEELSYYLALEES